MNFPPRALLALLTLFALAACGRAPADLPTLGGGPQRALADHRAPAEELRAQRDVLALPTASLPTPALADTVAGSRAPAPALQPPAPAVEQPAPTAAPPPTAEAPVPTAEPPAPTAEPFGQIVTSAPARIIIESIGLDRDLVAVGLDPSNAPVVPDHDVAWYSRSASPGTGENVVVWGHALRFRATADIPAPLERVREASVGDRVTVVTADGAPHDYVISEQIWATPDQVAFILPVGSERLTIVNCIGDYVVDASGEVVSMTHRLITVAEPVR